ncbi:MAG TPA: sensor domain-containing diguanylate cyclase [Candidatus Dormibacteraeota bacterium]
MANQPAARRRHRSFTVQFALVLVAVGLATALVAGVVAWVETQNVRSEQDAQAGLGASQLATSLVRDQTAFTSQRLACEVAGLAATAPAYTAGAAGLEALAQATAANASPGQELVFLGPSGQVLAHAPTRAGVAGLARLARESSGSARCASPTSPGFFARAGRKGLAGVGLATVSQRGRTLGHVLALTPLGPDVLRYAQRLVGAAGLHSTTALLVAGRLSLPMSLRGVTYAAGSRLPQPLRAALDQGGQAQASLFGVQYTVVGQALESAAGRPVGQLIVLESGAGIGVSVGDLALPLALAVAGVLLLGMAIVFLLVEHFLNRPLRRLDLAVQRLGLDESAAPVSVDGGAEEITRLADNFERVRKQLRRQLLVATGRTVITSTLTSNASMDQALEQVLRSLAEVLAAEVVMILLRPQPQMSRGLLLSGGLATPAPTWAELEGAGGVIGSLVREPRFLVRTELRPDERGALEERLGLHDCLVEPMRSDDHDLGLLLVGNKRNSYLDLDYTLCRDTADQIVVAFEKNTRLAVTQREATTDEMTGLYNYRFLVGYLDQQVNLAERAGSPLSVLMLDLDHFKAVNDSHGHPAGDRLLRQFASLMIETIRKSDLGARYGGEEFVVVMSNTSRSDAEVVADKIRAAVESMSVRLDDGSEVGITVSIGGVAFPEGSNGARNLLDLADRALYAAKRNGRNRVEFLDLAATAGEPVTS